MHQLDLFADMLGQANKREGLLARAMETIAEEGTGVVVVLNRQVPLSQVVRVHAGETRARHARNCATMASARRSSPSSASTT